MRGGHARIPRLLLGGTNKAYSGMQERFFRAFAKRVPGAVLLDSSKYIGRFLQLRRTPSLDVRGVYLVRDVRGVVHSFGKNVQTPKSPVQAILYYLLINLFGEITYRLHRKVIKLRYEDFVRDPRAGVRRILEHAGVGDGAEPVLPESYPVPHIVGGNRLKTAGSIRIRPDLGWKSGMSRTRQIACYLGAFPFMILNRYPL